MRSRRIFAKTLCSAGSPVYGKKARKTVDLPPVMVPQVANGPDFDTHLGEAYSLNLESVQQYRLKDQEGKLHLMGFWNHARMGNYADAISTALSIEHPPDITQTRTYCSKFGFAVGAEQAVSKVIDLFARFSWNDGATESWVFTEIDRSAQLGVNIKGNAWQRANDNVGVALVANALSRDHRGYLALGGYGFIIGDGRLNDGLKQIVECYCSARLVPWFWLSLDNQVVVRGHAEF